MVVDETHRSPPNLITGSESPFLTSKTAPSIHPSSPNGPKAVGGTGKYNSAAAGETANGNKYATANGNTYKTLAVPTRNSILTGSIELNAKDR